MKNEDLLLDDVQTHIDFWIKETKAIRTQFKRGKYLYKIERVEVN